jgi:hypothetical protein
MDDLITKFAQVYISERENKDPLESIISAIDKLDINKFQSKPEQILDKKRKRNTYDKGEIKNNFENDTEKVKNNVLNNLIDKFNDLSIDKSIVREIVTTLNQIGVIMKSKKRCTNPIRYNFISWIC